MSDVFADFRENEKPSEELFAKLDELVTKLMTAQKAVADAEDVLKKAQDAERTLREHDLPEFMDKLGMEEFTTKSGLKIKIKTKIRASIGNRKVAAYAWLEKNGYGNLIKRTVKVAFNRDQGDEAEELMKTLRDDPESRFAGVAQDLKVEAATLTSFVKEQLEAGKDIPQDIFGVFEQKSAMIEIKK